MGGIFSLDCGDKKQVHCLGEKISW